MNTATTSQAGLSEGERRKAEALHLLDATRAEFIFEARRRFLLILFEIPEATVDDLREVIEIPEGINPTALGAAINGLALGKMIHGVDYRKSSRPIAHARPNRVWRLADPVKARQWLATNPAPPGSEESPPPSGNKKTQQRELPGVSCHESPEA